MRRCYLVISMPLHASQMMNSIFWILHHRQLYLSSGEQSEQHVGKSHTGYKSNLQLSLTHHHRLKRRKLEYIKTVLKSCVPGTFWSYLEEVQGVLIKIMPNPPTAVKKNFSRTEVTIVIACKLIIKLIYVYLF